ncbi:denticleless protein homolog [Hyalella azteca]|uniref:Denticleless protein homolog n=1 Tax=Hyalella azteca TaxID=294128 RepID=A0A8B7NE30_HYAAZ|nr:denticleless protein homolog [Hyalella azteca]
MSFLETNIVQVLNERSLLGFSFPYGQSSFIPSCSSHRIKSLLDLKCTKYTDYKFFCEDDQGEVYGNQPMYCCSFGKDSNTGHLLAYGGEDGNVTIVNSAERSNVPTVISSCNESVHVDAVIDVSWVPNTEEILSCGGDKAVVLWKLGEGRLHPLLKLFGHSRTVKTLQINPYDPMVFVSGGRDGNIVVWDRRCSPQHRADKIESAHPSAVTGRVCSKHRTPNAPPSNAVSSLVFYEEHTLTSTGSTDGLIKMWDLRKSHCTLRSVPVPVHTLSQPQTSSMRGFGWACAPSRSHYLYALAMDYKIYAYHLAMPSAEPVSCYTGCLNTTHYVRMAVSSCGRYLVSGGADGRALVWLTSRPGPPVAQLTGHRGEVSAVDWGQFGGDKIATCGDEGMQKIYYMDHSFYEKNQTSENDDFFRGQVTLVDEAVLARCPPMSRCSKMRPLRYLRKLSYDVEYSGISQPLPPVPQTPRSRPKLSYSMSTPLRSNSHAPTLSTPGRSTDLPTRDPSTPIPTTPSSRATDNEARNMLLFTPHQSTHPTDSPRYEGENHSAQRASLLQTPRTPSSLDRSLTLLQWLSTAKKTPKPSPACGTPLQPTSAQNECTSASKRAGIKRKLTDVLEKSHGGEQENIRDDGSICNKRKPISPSKDVLVENNNLSQPSTVAKMLNYGKSNEKPKSSTSLKLETISEIAESVQPFEQSMLETIKNNSLRGLFVENKSRSSLDEDSSKSTTNTPASLDVVYSSVGSSLTPVKDSLEISHQPRSKSRFESPTANLPNFVKDGISPRPVPVLHEKQITSNWLSTLSSQRKLQFSQTSDGKAASGKVTDTISTIEKTAPSSSRKPAVKGKGKKNLKIVSLSDSPSNPAGNNSPRTTQMKLTFK